MFSKTDFVLFAVIFNFVSASGTAGKGVPSEYISFQGRRPGKFDYPEVGSRLLQIIPIHPGRGSIEVI